MKDFWRDNPDVKCLYQTLTMGCDDYDPTPDPDDTFLPTQAANYLHKNLDENTPEYIAHDSEIISCPKFSCFKEVKLFTLLNYFVAGQRCVVALSYSYSLITVKIYGLCFIKSYA